MTIHKWAQDWQIPAIALNDLMRRLQGDIAIASVGRYDTHTDGSEARQQSLVRLEAAQKGVWLTRNNVGVLFDVNDRPVRYGLANESKAQNETIKSADLIGIRKVLIQPQHVGHTIGQFVSREMKEVSWKYTGTGREAAQMKWIELITSYGGDACFCIGPGTI